MIDFEYTDEDLNADTDEILKTVFSSEESKKQQIFFVYDHDSRQNDSNAVLTSFDSAMSNHLLSDRILKFAKSSLSTALRHSSYIDKTTPPLELEKASNEYLRGYRIYGISAGDDQTNCSVNDMKILLPITIEANKLALLPSTSKDNSLKQLRKDIERDVLIVNGIQLSGSDNGLEGVIKLVTSLIQKVLRDCDLSPIEISVAETIAIEILKKATRTHSGAMAYQLLQYILNMETVTIVPVSTRAKPLSINISIDSTEGGNNWGLICKIQCSTFFNLRSSESLITHDEIVNFEKPAETIIIQALYENFICSEINIGGNYSITSNQKLLGTTATDGRVYVTLA